MKNLMFAFALIFTSMAVSTDAQARFGDPVFLPAINCTKESGEAFTLAFEDTPGGPNGLYQSVEYVGGGERFEMRVSGGGGGCLSMNCNNRPSTTRLSNDSRTVDIQILPDSVVGTIKGETFSCRKD